MCGNFSCLKSGLDKHTDMHIGGKHSNENIGLSLSYGIALGRHWSFNVIFFIKKALLQILY